jgi:glycosyltransferase involved in cell wall biosynthesis
MRRSASAGITSPTVFWGISDDRIVYSRTTNRSLTMRIALVWPHPLPFALGGAEYLAWGLQEHIARQTDHACEIVNLVSPERTLDDIVNSYEAFGQLDLSRFDCVVTGKYPAWMVSHPHLVVYMQHRLRGLYDTYPQAQASPHSTFAEVVRLRQDISDMRGGGPPAQADVDRVFDQYRQLRRLDLPEDVFAHPGPLARDIVHFLDDYALAPHRVARYGAISQTVRDRTFYFPADVPVNVVHHPTHGDGFFCRKDGYFFTCSRLDSAKRVDLIIDAMAHVSADIPLLIAGTGPAKAELEARAAGDPRIRFLGFVADDAMPSLYADALAVPFVPYDEDYGLITIEAMLSSKPVLTLTDSGGPREFVRDGETGYVTAPDATALGARMNELAADRPLARRMGLNAREAVAHINWSSVYDRLIAPQLQPQTYRPSGRRKLTVATTFPVYPPQGGGQLRVFNLYRQLASRYDIEIVSLGMVDTAPTTTEIAPGLTEIRIPKSLAHETAERDISARMDKIAVTDVVAARLMALTPDYRDVLRTRCRGSVAAIACHPYLFEEIERAAPGLPIWYEAQDVELDLKTRAFAGLQGGATLIGDVARIEAHAWRHAQMVFACATRDLDRLSALYGPTAAHRIEVPNGVDLDDIPFTALEARSAGQKERAASRAAAQRSALFIGSWHPPNIEAVETLLAIAPHFPQIAFLIAGTVCLKFEDQALPANVRLLGLVDAAMRDGLFAGVDMALNPMRSGSGTNLKMLDYFAAGAPVVTTHFGARGLAVESGVHAVVTPDDDFSAGLHQMLAMDEPTKAAQVAAARALVESRYSWTSIADTFAQACERLLPLSGSL